MLSGEHELVAPGALDALAQGRDLYDSAAFETPRVYPPTVPGNPWSWPVPRARRGQLPQG